MKHATLLGVIFVSIVWYTPQIFAMSTPNVVESYQRFTTTLSHKYSQQEQNNILGRLSSAIERYKDSIHNTHKLDILTTLERLNNEESFRRFVTKETSLHKQKEKESSLEGILQTGKIPYSELASNFRGVLTKNWKITQEQDYFYVHNFSNYLSFDDAYGVYKNTLSSNNIVPNKSFIYKDTEKNAIFFVKDTHSSKILPTKLLSGIANKKQVLTSLGKDLKYQSSHIDRAFSKIRLIVQGLTKGASREQKIAAIYAWILQNISYTENINFEDQQIFSGIETFRQKTGVCTGYTRLFLYMLSLAGIHDVEVIEGHVIDAPDFPHIGHAWVRIGDKYYDPTFDDPIGANNTKTPSQYTYFGLPRDIFYTNRYDYKQLPVTLKLAKKSEIRKHIYDRLKRLIPKYQQSLSKYPVFGSVVFREKYNISPLTVITPELLAKKLGSYKVQNDSFRYQDASGKTKQISSMRYYTLTANNTQQILKQINYDLSKTSLFHWQNKAGTWEWRLVYKLEQR